MPERKPQAPRERCSEEDWDPYAVTPEDALDAARREVKRWRLEQLAAHHSASAELDPLTEWFVLAWDAFKAPEFPYDEALRLARVVGLDLDRDVIGRLAEKKRATSMLWDSAKRAAKGALGPADGSRALHRRPAPCRLPRAAGTDCEAGRRTAEDGGAATAIRRFPLALRRSLEVLPVSSTFTKIADETGAVAEAASDFDALEHLRRLAFSDRVPEPEQLGLWAESERCLSLLQDRRLEGEVRLRRAQPRRGVLTSRRSSAPLATTGRRVTSRAGVLALASRGIEGLVRNDGRMRLVVGCTLGPTEVEAIERGEEARQRRRGAGWKRCRSPPQRGEERRRAGAC